MNWIREFLKELDKEEKITLLYIIEWLKKGKKDESVKKETIQRESDIVRRWRHFPSRN